MPSLPAPLPAAPGTPQPLLQPAEIPLPPAPTTMPSLPAPLPAAPGTPQPLLQPAEIPLPPAPTTMPSLPAPLPAVPGTPQPLLQPAEILLPLPALTTTVTRLPVKPRDAPMTTPPKPAEKLPNRSRQPLLPKTTPALPACRSLPPSWLPF